MPVVHGNLQVKNSTIDIIEPNDLIHFIRKSKGYIQNEFLSNLKDRIKNLQLTFEDRITLKGILNSWWFSNYKRFFIFGLIYGTVYLVGTDIFSFIISKFYNINLNLPKYTLTDNLLAIFYVGVLSVLLGKIIFDIFKIDLKIELLNITAMVFVGWLPFLAYSLYTYKYLIGELAELFARLVSILISYFMLKLFKFKLIHIYLK